MTAARGAPRRLPRLRPASAAALVAALLVLPGLAIAQEGDGYDGYVQSGTCESPDPEVRVSLEGSGDHDVEPYTATSADGESVDLGYYGSPELPGFGLGAVYADQAFSLVITDPADQAVACGDLLEPDEDRFREAGMALVQLAPVEGATVQGVALVQRARLERELDVTPTRVRILLTDEAQPSSSDRTADGYEGYVQSGTCESPDEAVRVQLETFDDGDDVRPYRAQPQDLGRPVTAAYYGAPLAPGFGLASTYTDQEFSLVMASSDRSAEPAACGDVLEPGSEDFTDAGLALVLLQPVGDEGVQGYALVERVGMQRELDVTPTRIRIVLFSPPVGG